MKLEKINITSLKDKKTLKEVMKEAHKYGIERGGASAGGDKYGTFGGPKFDDVLRDYLSEKLGIEGDIINIAERLKEIPSGLIDKLRKGFDNGYHKEVKASSEEEDDEW